MYPIEIRLCSKNGYFTPAEARAYYGRYGRDGITVHWWGDGTGASNHDNIVNYMYNGSVQGTKSVNYVLSDNKITMMVNPDDVAWTSQSGNATTISVETQPTLNGEGYKKWGWLSWQLEQRYGKGLRLYPHNYWNPTQCPGSISLDRITQEKVKWASGGYNQQPVPTPPPTPAPINIIYEALPAPVTYRCKNQPTNLWNFNTTSWTGFTVVKPFNKGEEVVIVGKAIHPLGGVYLMTEYSFSKKITNGFNQVDMEVKPAPAPAPVPVPEPIVEAITPVKKYTLNNAKLVNIKDMSVVKTFALDTPMDIAGKSTWNGNEFLLTQYAVDKNTKQGFLVGDLKNEVTPTPEPEPEKPEWIKNLKDIDDTEYWFVKDQDLIDITTGKSTGTKSFKKDESFVSSAITSVGNTEYRITDYSFQKGIFNGVPTNSLTLTPPGVPDIPPVTNPDLVDKNVIIAFLEGIVKLIVEFISKLRSK